MGFQTAMRISASGLTSQRMRMDVISSNIANVSTTRSEDGGPYKRREVIFGSALARVGKLMADGRNMMPAFAPAGVRVVGIASQAGVRLVNDPQHPDADENGDVAYPAIDMVQEMTDMMSATRAYEASVTAVTAAKGMALKALELGRS
jgi:flagellar basal-body rod protein FlgC